MVFNESEYPFVSQFLNTKQPKKPMPTSANSWFTLPSPSSTQSLELSQNNSTFDNSLNRSSSSVPIATAYLLFRSLHGAQESDLTDHSHQNVLEPEQVSSGSKKFKRKELVI